MTDYAPSRPIPPVVRTVTFEVSGDDWIEQLAEAMEFLRGRVDKELTKPIKYKNTKIGIWK